MGDLDRRELSVKEQLDLPAAIALGSRIKETYTSKDINKHTTTRFDGWKISST